MSTKALSCCIRSLRALISVSIDNVICATKVRNGALSLDNVIVKRC
jgi:hypothetical protein